MYIVVIFTQISLSGFRILMAFVVCSSQKNHVFKRGSCFENTKSKYIDFFWAFGLRKKYVGVQNLEKAKGMFEKMPVQIVYCYNIYQNEFFDRMKEEVENLQFFQGIPTREDLERFSKPGQHSVLIIDD